MSFKSTLLIAAISALSEAKLNFGEKIVQKVIAEPLQEIQTKLQEQDWEAIAKHAEEHPELATPNLFADADGNTHTNAGRPRVTYPYNPTVNTTGREIMANLDNVVMMVWRPAMSAATGALAPILCPMIVSFVNTMMGGGADNDASYTACENVAGTYVDYIFYGGDIINRGPFWEDD